MCKLLYFLGDKGLCPVCGEPVHLTGATTDGRLIASCGDAFQPAQWEDNPELHSARTANGGTGAERENKLRIEVGI